MANLNDDADMDGLVSPHPVGTKVGHYEILGPLGRGGMGLVYVAKDLRLDRSVALKRPFPGQENNIAAHKRFLREANAASRVSHPSVVPVFEIFEHESVPWIAMQLIKGSNLRDLIAVEGRLPIERVLRYSEDLVNGLEAAHAEHIIHRDINPKNVLIDHRDHALLADFGLARYFVPPEEINDASTQSFAITEHGAVVGTPIYRSPEQCLGRELDFRTDIYSLGTVLYEMTTSSAAFAADSAGQLVDKILHAAPRPVINLAPETPPEFASIIDKCISKDPDDRYQHASELASDLHHLKQRYEFENYVPEEPRVKRGSRILRATKNPYAAVRYFAKGPLWRRTATLLVLAFAVWAGKQEYDRLNRPQLQVRSITPLLTQAGRSCSTSISPDGLWLAYCTRLQNQDELYVRRLNTGQPRLLMAQEEPIRGQVWSPDGEEIAVVVQVNGNVFLRTWPAFGGAATRSVRMDQSFMHAVPIRWIRSHVYMDIPRSGLWRYDVESSQLQQLIVWQESDRRNHFDVCESEERVTYTMTDGDRQTVWTSRIDGTEARLLTPPDASDFRSRWMRRNCQSIIFSSLHEGQMDLWHMSISDGARQRITFSTEFDYVQDVALNGGMITLVTEQERADLWLVDPNSPDMTPTQLTDDDLLYVWPSASFDGKAWVFQRSKPVPDRISTSLGAELCMAEFASNGFSNIRSLGVDGGSAVLSPNARWIAFIRDSRARRPELWLQEVSSSHSWQVSGGIVTPSTYMYQIARMGRTLAWNYSGDRLFFIKVSAEAPEIRSLWASLEATDDSVVVSYPKSHVVRDLCPSSTGQRLAYVHADPDKNESELRYHNLATGQDRVLLTYEHGPWDYLQILGWLEPANSLVALKAVFNSDLTERVSVLSVDLRGNHKELGTIDRAFSGASRLDVESSVVFVTKVDEHTAAHNIYVMDLSDGSTRAITTNQDSNVSFSGLTVLPDGRLIFTKYQSREVPKIIHFQI